VQLVLRHGRAVGKLGNVTRSIREAGRVDTEEIVGEEASIGFGIAVPECLPDLPLQLDERGEVVRTRRHARSLAGQCSSGGRSFDTPRRIATTNIVAPITAKKSATRNTIVPAPRSATSATYRPRSDRGRPYDGGVRRGASGIIVMFLVAVAACGGHDTTQQLQPAPRQASTAPSSAPPVTRRVTTAPTLPRTTSFVYAVQARNPTISVYPAPSTKTVPLVLPNPWVVDPSRPDTKVPQVFLVQSGKYVPGWLHVLLPVRPNGSTGWVRYSDTSIQQIAYRVRVELGAHRILVYNGNNVVYQGQVAIGKPSTPTPTGRYYIRVLIQAPNPNTVYGPFAYGLSSHSDVLSNFNGGDGEIGIHGNDDASVLGKSVTHGCIRMDNYEISRLAGLLPLGTPVLIVA